MKTKLSQATFVLFLFILLNLIPKSVASSGDLSRFYVLKVQNFKHHIDKLNRNDEELNPQYFNNADSWNFLVDNIPFFECPHQDIERTYYFRWWSYRKHIQYVTSPLTSMSFFVITEFLPKVPWSGVFNTISCAAGHHLREGRWLINSTYMEDYSRFWLREGNPTQYSFWIADSIRALCLVNGNFTLARELLPALKANFAKLRRTNTIQPGERVEAGVISIPGLYFNTDNRDGMEFSIGGQDGLRAYRPTLNSYQCGEALAISRLSKELGDSEQADKYAAIAAEIKKLLQEVLWDEKALFFKALPYRPHDPLPTNSSNSYQSQLVSVRELIGFTPWFFNIPSDDKLVAWGQLMDRNGFYAPHGLTTAEQRHPKFAIDYLSSHECLWNGPSWPYATSVTLAALANVLNTKEKLAAPFVDKEAFFNLTLSYARSHRRTLSTAPFPAFPASPALGAPGVGELRLFHPLQEAPPLNPATPDPSRITTTVSEEKVVSWIDENLNPFTGEWVSRAILQRWGWPANKGGRERGKDYNHSTFVDLVITGLVGLRPRPSNELLVINPLLPPHIWDYFCIDGLKYHGVIITVLWDKSGLRYGHEKGFHVLINGIKVASASRPRKLKIKLSQFL